MLYSSMRGSSKDCMGGLGWSWVYPGADVPVVVGGTGAGAEIARLGGRRGFY